ncbi:MAG: cysteine desulfurase [Gammaproteobacteria bacterium]|nr:cysteine desulfurase [Gammaproteobacteria bacterium]
MKGLYWAGRADGKKLVVISAIEHHAILDPAQWLLTHEGAEVIHLPVTPDGVIDLVFFKKLIDDRGPEIAVLSIMHANNETGVIERVAPLAKKIRALGGWLHVDAVQGAGKIPLDFGALGAHTLSLSAHKLYGPKGVGALIVAPEVLLTPMMWGGGQESGLRPGTEHVAGIVGFGQAARLARLELTSREDHLLDLRMRLEAGLLALGGVTIFASKALRLPNTVQFSVEGFDGEALVMLLDRRGFAVSSGSACHSGGGAPSPVLLAMGVDETLAKGAIRVSLGVSNTREEVDRLIETLKDLRHLNQ